MASQENHVETVKLLLANGANLQALTEVSHYLKYQASSCKLINHNLSELGWFYSAGCGLSNKTTKRL